VPDRAAKLTFSGPAEPACLDRIHELLNGLWEEHPDVLELDRMMFTTAVLEVGNNVVRHGGPAMMSLRLTCSSRRMEAYLCDDGAALGIDPASATMPGDRQESGRGLAMARMALDDFAYEHADGLNRWHLVRLRRRGGGCA
jgi:serine/threonine-protein kinase RsbW